MIIKSGGRRHRANCRLVLGISDQMWYTSFHWHLTPNHVAHLTSRGWRSGWCPGGMWILRNSFNYRNYQRVQLPKSRTPLSNWTAELKGTTALNNWSFIFMPLFLISIDLYFFIIVTLYLHIFLFFMLLILYTSWKIRLLYYLLCLGYSPIVWVSDDSHWW